MSGGHEGFSVGIWVVEDLERLIALDIEHELPCATVEDGHREPVFPSTPQKRDGDAAVDPVSQLAKRRL
jgi:hypothetical protein